jgi:hypothetical protein
MRYTVKILCDDTCHPSYPDWLVYEFMRMEPGYWLPAPDPERKLWRPADHVAYIDRATGQVAGDTFTPPFEPRDSYNFECYRCRRRGRRVTVPARAESLNVIFEGLYEHGEPCISFRNLAAILRSTGAR